MRRAIFIEGYPHPHNRTGAVANATAALFLVVYPPDPPTAWATFAALAFTLTSAIHLLSWTTLDISGEDGDDLRYTVWGCPKALLELAETAEETHQYERALELVRRVQMKTRGRRYLP